MKKTILLLLIAIATVGFAVAQDGTTTTAATTTSVLAPDFKNQPMLLENGKLVKLEKVSSEVKQKVNGMGWGGVSQNIHIIGKTSNVNVSKKPEFVVKVDADTDPETVFYLAKCLEHKGVREVEVGKTSAFAAYGATGKSAKRFQIKISYTKMSEGVYKINIDGPALESGEYAFVMASTGAVGQMSNVYCFTVK